MHDLAGLNCDDHGGPTNELAAEMVYWRDIPSDAAFKSPFGNNVNVGKGRRRKYLTFEPDGGGFNNARMSMETIILMSHAMGRTLVMPPSQGIYLLRKDRDKQRVHFSFEDFYHMEQVGFEHEGLDIIGMDDFLKLEAMTGNLRNKTTGLVQFPPNNRTNWDGIDPKPLKEYLRDVTLTPLTWNPDQCLAAFPSDDGPQHFEELNDMLEEIKKNAPNWQKYKDKPTPVDGSAVERLREALSTLPFDLSVYSLNVILVFCRATASVTSTSYKCFFLSSNFASNVSTRNEPLALMGSFQLTVPSSHFLACGRASIETLKSSSEPLNR